MSRPSTKPFIRDLLLKHNETGLTMRQLEKLTGRDMHSLKSTLITMYGVYRSHWVKPFPHGGWAAVYKIVEVPLDAPRPPTVSSHAKGPRLKSEPDSIASSVPVRKTSSLVQPRFR